MRFRGANYNRPTVRRKWNWIDHTLRKLSNSVTITEQFFGEIPQGPPDTRRPKLNTWKRILKKWKS